MSKHIAWLDAARIIAIFGMILIHVTAPVFADNLSDFYVKIVSYLSPLVFPVYFMHLLVIAILSSGILGFSLDQFSIHPLMGILLLSIATFIVSFILAAIASKIPFISKLIG